MDIFKSQIDIIYNNNFKFYNPAKFEKEFRTPKSKKKILLTIDDAFTSFYENAWPYLKKNKIPFILFVSTEAIGKFGYMTWSQIKEIEKEEFVFLGNHSHSHEYLINYNFKEFKNDIDKSINNFKKKIGYNPKFFSYPFGEYSFEQKNYIAKKFKFAFGQHSGVIDLNKDKYELPRFPINEKYGDLNRFERLVKFLPLQYNNIIPEDKFVDSLSNPPEMHIEFFDAQKNLDIISCYSNEGAGWNKTNIKLENNKLNIFFREKFKERRGRINCSMRDTEGWRWLGIQFSIN
jgi:peptidoglycan/xylan/chitin deacetylase (PgdA/CDA1 family)